MGKNIRKFEEYTQDPLMNDVEKVDISTEEEKDFDPKEWEIESVIDVHTEDPQESEINRIEDSLDEAAITFDTQVPKDIKRGEYLWITALIRRKGSTSPNDPGRQSVIKVRVVDIYYGLAHLNKVINQR